MRTGWYEGQQVEILRRAKKNTRIKLVDGTEQKVPTEKISDQAPESNPTPAAETAPAPIPEPSFDSLMGSESPVVAAPPESEVVEAPAPPPAPVVALPAPVAAPVAPTIAPPPTPDDIPIQSEQPQDIVIKPQPVRYKSKQGAQPPAPPVIPVSLQNFVGKPERNPLPQNPPARRRVLGAALHSRKIDKPQPASPDGAFPSHMKKLGNESD